MAEWAQISLARAASWHSGGTPRTSEPSFWGGDIPWISAASLKDFYVDSSDRNVTELGAANGTRLVPKDTVLIIVRGMSLKSELRMGITRRTVAFGQDCKALIPAPGIHPPFLAYAIRAKTDEILALVDEAGHGTGRLQTELIAKITIPVPELIEEQVRAVALLEALDDKIAVNERIAVTSRALGLTEYALAVESGEASEARLGAVVSLLTRGVAPKYSDDAEELTVLNQKCIRDGRIILAPSRKTLGDKVPKTKRLIPHDVLINSTGVGTLGRVARWMDSKEATVDSHVTIVRLAPEKVDLVCGGFALLRAQPEIEAMGVGSTGQTELRRSQLEDLEILLPAESRQPSLRARLDALETRSDAALAESHTLAALRDTLLPQLMSGKLRVRDAERIVEDAT
ncbi:restriction endonuclease subunit S [Streptomyces sp. NPDC051322]|uniref:restriction endonuclease subunit S n=1 Tax=Streptomyces sp. NPDC051322 TaxID=3154645 RepID=UPI00344BE632